MVDDAGSVALRPALPEDAEAIWRVAVDAARELCRSHYTDREIGAWVGSSAPEHYRQAMAEPGSLTLVAEKGGEVVGFGALGTDSRRVRAVYVRPEHARSGIGTAILAALEGAARQAGVTRLHLDASLNAVGFYARAGYQEVGRFTYALRSGVEIACIRMTKPLDGTEEA